MEDLASGTVQELLEELCSIERQLLELSLKKCAGLLQKPHVVSDLRRQGARIRTFLGQKTCKASDNQKVA